MIVWPADIDVFMEINNGRYLRLMDIGRFEYGIKIRLIETLKRHGKWHVAALARTAVTDKNGAVPTKEVSKELGGNWEYRMPDWVKHRDESDKIRSRENDF